MQTQLPCRLCSDVADAMRRAADVPSACESVVATLFSTLLKESVVFQIRSGVSTRVAGVVNRELHQRWGDTLLTLPPDASIGVIGPKDAPATFVFVGVIADNRMFLVVDDDLTASREVLAACASIMALGLEAAHQRDESRGIHRLFRNGYRLALALSRARGTDSVEKAITAATSRLFRADRVSIGRYQPENEQLVVTAARGFRIPRAASAEQGEWVLGHVYQSGRAIFVNNTAELPASSTQRRRYSSRAFAVVPLVHGRQTVGVVCVTEKRDRAPFAPSQQFLLRALAPVMAAALTAADRTDEAEQLRHAAAVDPVTGVHNRTYLDRRLHEEVERSQREKRPLSLLMVDIDNLKPINDRHGHMAGDAVLKRVAIVIRSAVRIFDVCARYGGDEFVVIMPNSDAQVAYACAERIRAYMTQALDDTAAPGATLSIGVASATPEDTPLDLITRADRALYEAKAHGKNEVRVGGITPDSTTRNPSPPPGHAPEAPYILIADPPGSRSGVYRERADYSRLGLLVARDGTEALRVMRQFGPPVLLVVDLGTRSMNGVALLEWLHARQAHTRVVALSSSATLKRYLSTTYATGHATVLRADAPLSRLHTAITASLSSFAEGRKGHAHETPQLSPVNTSSPSPEDAAVAVAEPDINERRVGVHPAPEGSPATSQWHPTLLERKRGEFEVARELARLRREERQLSVVLFDISGTMGVERTASRDDATIASICETLIRVIRPSDLPIQWGRHELLLVLPGLAGDAARTVAERVRAAMQAASRHQFPVSGGVAELQRDEQFGDVVKRARDRVMLALRHGDNRVS